MKLLDSCFLIDLHRELRAKQKGRARAYLEANSAEHFSLSVITVTEFLEGFADPKDGEPWLRAFRWIEVDALVARRAAQIRRHLRQTGSMIGDFDILIAATALNENITLVSNNKAHFTRVEGLNIESY